jgi:hypothetical protein
MYSNKDLNSGLYVYFQHTAIYPKTMLTGEDERLADMAVLVDCAYILTMRGITVRIQWFRVNKKLSY